MLTLQIASLAVLGLLAYTYFGYSLLVVLLARLVRRPEPAEPSDWPRVSLVIPAHNEQAVLAQKLDNALAIDYPPGQLEIVVASDGSQDRTVALAESFAERGVRVLAFAARRGKASAVNDAVAACRGEVVCLCDANVMFRPEALRRLVARLADPLVGAASGDVRLASHESNFEHGETLYYRLERAIQLAESDVGSLIGVDGGMYVVRRRLYRPLNPETILDDFVISMEVLRQGQRVVYEPDAVATENGTPTATIEFRRRVRMSAGMVQVLKRGLFPWRRPVIFWQFVSHKMLRVLAPWLLLALALLTLLLATRGWSLLAVVLGAGQCLVYGLALAGALSLRLRAKPWGGIPFYFVLGHVAIFVGTLKGLLNRQSVTWKVTERTGGSPAPV